MTNKFEYKVVEMKYRLDMFNYQVSRLLLDGWLLHGNVIITTCDSEIYYHQTLLRELPLDDSEDDEENDTED